MECRRNISRLGLNHGSAVGEPPPLSSLYFAASRGAECNEIEDVTRIGRAGRPESSSFRDSYSIFEDHHKSVAHASPSISTRRWRSLHREPCTA